MSWPRYVPVFKSKQGEFGCFKTITDDVGALTTPLLDMLFGDPINLDDQVRSLSRKLCASWFVRRPIFLDMGGINENALLADRELAIPWFYDRLDEVPIPAVPVWRAQPGVSIPRTLAEVARRDDRGLCLRIQKTSFFDQSAMSSIFRAVESAGFDPSEVDVVIDLFRIDADVFGLYKNILPQVINQVPGIGELRSLTLAAGAYPESGVFHGPGVYTLRRWDWDLWSHLTSDPSKLARTVNFGDYGPICPRADEPSTENMRPAASLKYTTADSWLVFRGTKVSDRGGHEQYRDLAKALRDHELFAAPDHCAAEGRIIECAEGGGSTGNPPSWVRFVLTHHVTCASRQVASRSAT